MEALKRAWYYVKAHLEEAWRWVTLQWALFVTWLKLKFAH